MKYRILAGALALATVSPAFAADPAPAPTPGKPACECCANKDGERKACDCCAEKTAPPAEGQDHSGHRDHGGHKGHSGHQGHTGH